MKDFESASKIRVLTFSAIKPDYNKDFINAIKKKKTNDIKIIVGMPGLFSRNIQYSNKDIANALDKIKTMLTPNTFPPGSLNICFKNHAKIIGTENIVYVGSQNFTEASEHNYEAGVIIRDPDIIKNIYEDFVDDIKTITYMGDNFDKIKVKLLIIIEQVVDLQLELSNFVYYFEERVEYADNTLDICNSIIRNVKGIRETDLQGLTPEISQNVESILGELYDLRLLIKSFVNGSDYMCSNDVFYDKYEEVHQINNGVDTKDSWIDKDTPYKPLNEEEDADYIISEYWEEDMSNNENYLKIDKDLSLWIEKCSGAIEWFNNHTAEDVLKEEAVRQGTDASVPK